MNKLQQVFKMAKIYHRDYGLRNLCIKILFKICPFFVYYETVLYMCDIQMMANSMIKPKLDAAHSVLSLKDYRELEQIKKPEDPHFISKRLGSGEQCYVAKDRHSICCYFWVAPGEREIEHEARILTIAGHQIYIHDCFTIEQCRGKSILPYFVEQICFKMKEQGYKEAVAVVYNDNYPSRKCFEKIGFQKGELIRHFVIPFTGKKYYTRRILKTK